MSAITPFTIAIDEADLDDLKQRLGRTRYPEREAVDDWSQGIPLATVQSFAEYWRTGYDWRRCEQEANEWPQFMTNIEGLDIHFFHIRSEVGGATPLLMTHGWPGSVLEFLPVIESLVNPVAREMAFDLVIPALPGYGFSGKPARHGMGIPQIARLWDELMKRLGYHHYLAHGGDWGGLVTQAMGVQQPRGLQAIHTTLPIVAPGDAESPTEAELKQLASYEFYDRWDSGYSKQQSTRPQTVGYGLADSPVGQLAWILEKYGQWTDCAEGAQRVPDNAVSRDRLLDVVTLYWLTNSAASSARLYWESFTDFDTTPIELPVGISQFPHEVVRPLRRWLDSRFSDIVYFNDEIANGGHFPALEVPEALVSELHGWRGALAESGI
ncbi:epoxide hydrolase [Luminiphilus syltensis NOR5-1B]|uniref:Epoxide hydrolase n=1 Tax=Luminiphilus syltensis NOR5-1B TaxID=565045 RepID=B8KUX6_9GAMM|nr:epoxide hydrolase family protein [Luminiphilus syltensis]EED34105.1 epoxide hydrolase [Luminiphilus syltensis NOR5-1B]